MWDVNAGRRGMEDLMRCILLENNLQVSTTNGQPRKVIIRKFGRRIGEYHASVKQTVNVRCKMLDQTMLDHVKADALVAFRLSQLPSLRDKTIKILDDRQCTGDRCFGWVTQAFAKPTAEASQEPVSVGYNNTMAMPQPVVTGDIHVSDGGGTTTTTAALQTALDGHLHISPAYDDMVGIVKNMSKSLRHFVHPKDELPSIKEAIGASNTNGSSPLAPHAAPSTPNLLSTPPASTRHEGLSLASTPTGAPTSQMFPSVVHVKHELADSAKPDCPNASCLKQVLREMVETLEAAVRQKKMG